MHKQEIFSLLVHVLWRIKMEIQENATVRWRPKSTTTHPYKWEVRVCMYLREGARAYCNGSHMGRTSACPVGHENTTSATPCEEDAL